MASIDYVPSSLLPALDVSMVRKYEQWLLRNGYGEGRLVFDPAYINHLQEFHGGVPVQKRFSTPTGSEFAIDRFMHFAQLPAGHELQYFGVETAWSQASDRLGDFLMPFAELGFGDMLCFDYSKEGRPEVVVWLHEESDENAPKTEFVARSFDEFLRALHA